MWSLVELYFLDLLHYLLEGCISLTSSVIYWRSRISLTSSVICWRGCISLTSSVICWRVCISWPPPLFAGGSFLDHFHYFVHFVSFLLLVSFALLVSFVLPASSVPLVSFSSSCFKFFLFLILLAFSLLQFLLLIFVLVFLLYPVRSYLEKNHVFHLYTQLTTFLNYTTWHFKS